MLEKLGIIPYNNTSWLFIFDNIKTNYNPHRVQIKEDIL